MHAHCSYSSQRDVISVNLLFFMASIYLADVGFTVDANALQSYLLATKESGMWQVRFVQRATECSVLRNLLIHLR